MNTVSDVVDKLFETAFPTIKPAEPDYVDRWIADDAKRALYVATRTPQLERIYRVTPERVQEALDDTAMYLCERHTPLLTALLTRDDHAEIGRLVLAAIDARIRERAEDDAGEQSYDAIPERAR